MARRTHRGTGRARDLLDAEGGRQVVGLEYALEATLELKERPALDEKQCGGTEITIAQGEADFVELAGVDNTGYVVGDGGDEVRLPPAPLHLPPPLLKSLCTVRVGRFLTGILARFSIGARTHLKLRLFPSHSPRTAGPDASGLTVASGGAIVASASCRANRTAATPGHTALAGGATAGGAALAVISSEEWAGEEDLEMLQPVGLCLNPPSAP